MSDVFLALNAGSSSFKFAVATAEDPTQRLLNGSIERIGTEASTMRLAQDTGETIKTEIGPADHRAALERLFQEIGALLPDRRITGIAHRIVHGGTVFSEPVRVTAEVTAEIEALVPLAPLHQPHGLRAIHLTSEVLPEALQVACFDTAFHAVKPWVNTAYALPQSYYDDGLRRYGFHGLACASICRNLTAQGFDLTGRKIAIAHLGNGCSVTAVAHGAPVATSMGFSTLDGLAIGTRCGGIDSGVLLHLLRNGHDAAAIEKLLYHQSGLLGLSGLSNDMRDLVEAETEASTGAITYFKARLVEEISRMAGAMGGLDAVIFSGGIGENSEDIRNALAEGLAFLPGPDGNGVLLQVEPADEEAELLSALKALSA